MTDETPPTGPRWLSEAEQQSWVAVSGVAGVLPAALDAQLQRDAGLTLFEYFVLSRLAMAAERTLRMSEVAALALGSLSRLSNVVKRLEQRGWVIRSPDPGDGRYTVARLTDDGWDRVRAAAPGHVSAVRRYLVDVLDPDELEQFAALSQRILDRVQADGRCPPPDC